VVERTFGDQQRWFGGKILRYQGLAKAHAWQILLAVAYNLRKLPQGKSGLMTGKSEKRP